MSPEQAAGEAESLGPATDVYGLGAILFALLTGEPPVAGNTIEEVLDRVRRGAIRSPRSLNPNSPAALEAVCLKALATMPGTATRRRRRWPRTSSAGWPTSRSRPTARRGRSTLARWRRRHRDLDAGRRRGHPRGRDRRQLRRAARRPARLAEKAALVEVSRR